MFIFYITVPSLCRIKIMTILKFYIACQIVVFLSFFGVSEYFICLADFFELLFRCLVIWICIRMMLFCKLSEILFYLILGCTLIYTKNLVIIPIFQCASPPVSFLLLWKYLK